MKLFSSLICEYPLPVPFEKFTEEEKKDFENIKWDEVVFQTYSFLDEDAFFRNILITYTITDDGFLYKGEAEWVPYEDKTGEIKYKEKDNGIEKQDLTGELYFVTQVFGEKNDYVLTFKVIFYKGELKELTFEDKTRESNEKRKEFLRKMQESVIKNLEDKKSPWYNFIYFIKSIFIFLLQVIKKPLLTLYNALTRIQDWIDR